MADYDPSELYRVHFAGDNPDLIYKAAWDDEWGCWCLLMDHADVHVRDNGAGLPVTDFVELIEPGDA